MRRIGTFLADSLGNVVLVFAFLLPAMLGMAGLVIDVGLALRERNVLLTSAEASALATARYIPKSDRSAALAMAQSYAGKNRPEIANLVTDFDLEFGRWEGAKFTAAKDANAVRVTASRNASRDNGVKTFLARLFGLDVWTISQSAIAVLDGNPVCILALHPDHSDAFDVRSKAQIDAPDCQVHVNSRHKGAIDLGADAHVNVKSLRVVGSVDRSGSASVTPEPVTGVEPMDDPYASLAPPTNRNCGGPKLIRDVTRTLSPNHAFCDGLTIDGATVTFEPGIYVITGNLTMKNGAAIMGSDVLIYLEGAGSDLFFHKKTSFNLKAPTSGPYAGIVLWSDRRNTKDHDIYTKFGAVAEGTIYAPSSQVEFENDVVWEAQCIRIVVARLELDINSRYATSNPYKNCRNNIRNSGGRIVR